LIHELFQYNWYARRRFLDSIAELPWAQVVERCGASFDSVRNVFVHSLQAEQSWIRRLSGKSAAGIYDTPFSTFRNADAIRAYADAVEAETREYLGTVTDEVLRSTLEYQRRDGTRYRYAVADALMHVIEEEIHHRGELLCLFWQRDVRPPYTSYLHFKGQVD
jgi:uncharacterized damage-inducible protein DinB